MPNFDIDCEHCGQMAVTYAAYPSEFTCPVCDAPAVRLWTVGEAGYKIAPDRSAAQDDYMSRPDVQAKLRSGEYTIPGKSSDARQH